jgi:hypothetical protein
MAICERVDHIIGTKEIRYLSAVDRGDDRPIAQWFVLLSPFSLRNASLLLVLKT